MIHISKSQKTGKFHIGRIADAKNQELLSSSEGVTHRSNAIKNIRANMKVWNSSDVLVQDNTGKKPKIILVTQKSQLVSDSTKFETPYEPGK